MVAETIQPGVEAAREWFRWYLANGFNALPSCPEKGYPTYSHTTARDNGVKPSLFDHFPFANLQIATGVRWGLIVVDLDGRAGIEEWGRWTLQRPAPETWTVGTPRGGRQLWFSVPRDAGPIRKADLWTGPGEHEGIEVLGDQSLAKAPPSYKVIGGRKVHYAFLPGLGPDELIQPAPLPGWVAEMARAARPKVETIQPAPVQPMLGRKVTGGGYYDFSDVLAAIPDKAELASRWGLRLATQAPNAAGFLKCHAIGREDRTPSASFDPINGCYSEPGKGHLSLFNLAVALGAYSSIVDAKIDLGRMFGASPQDPSVPRRRPSRLASCSGDPALAAQVGEASRISSPRLDDAGVRRPSLTAQAAPTPMSSQPEGVLPRSGSTASGRLARHRGEAVPSVDTTGPSRAIPGPPSGSPPPLPSQAREGRRLEASPTGDLRAGIARGGVALPSRPRGAFPGIPCPPRPTASELNRASCAG